MGWGYLCSPLCCLHTAIHISSLYGFWHCHPYILQHSPLKTQIRNIQKNLYIHSHELVKLYGHDGYWVSTARSLIKLPECSLLIRESVDSLCRDGADTPIVRVHWKAFLTREYSRFKPFSAREWPIRPLLYPTIPHK